VEGYSHSLRRELRLVGVKVIILGPGAIKSEMSNKDRLDGNLYKGTAYETAFAKFGAMNQGAERDAATPESSASLSALSSKRRVRRHVTSSRAENC
jgi:short-subunit dehydrogenase